MLIRPTYCVFLMFLALILPVQKFIPVSVFPGIAFVLVSSQMALAVSC